MAYDAGPLLPAFETEAQYRENVGRLEPWLPAVREVCRRERIAPMRALRAGLSETFPTVIIPPRHVLKLFGPWLKGATCFNAELTAHQLMSVESALPVPRQVAQGRLDEQWSYLVTSFVTGIEFAQVRLDLSPANMHDVATWLGRFVAKLHALPISASARDEAWRLWRERMSWRYDHAPEILRGYPALPGWAARDVAAWLPPFEAIVPSESSAVLLHSDLHDEHVLGELFDGRFEARWVIDFDRSQIGHPYYELGPLVHYAFRGDPALISAFVEAAELPRPATGTFAQLALAYVVLHDADQLSGLAAIDQSRGFDELARRLFGSD